SSDPGRSCPCDHHAAWPCRAAPVGSGPVLQTGCCGRSARPCAAAIASAPKTSWFFRNPTLPPGKTFVQHERRNSPHSPHASTLPVPPCRRIAPRRSTKPAHSCPTLRCGDITKSVTGQIDGHDQQENCQSGKRYQVRFEEHH